MSSGKHCSRLVPISAVERGAEDAKRMVMALMEVFMIVAILCEEVMFGEYK